jgi:ribosomal protein S18 acetylase RimI-like enzyme
VPRPHITLRPATPSDATAIASIWHEGWPDGHLGLVPPELVEHRQRADFERLAAARIDATTVATIDGVVAGFVTVVGDELEQVYVRRAARGSGAAPLLLRHGERTVAAGARVAWLAVVAGNRRARHFYEREGWHDAGPYDNPADIGGGRSLTVPTRRYEKSLGTAGHVIGAA